MNGRRRTVLRIQIEILKKVKDEIECVKDEEEYAYDNYPENLKESEKGAEMENNVETLSTIVDDIDSIIDEIENII